MNRGESNYELSHIYMMTSSDLDIVILTDEAD